MFGWLRILASRMRGWLSLRHVDEDFTQELESHLEMLERRISEVACHRRKRAARPDFGWAE